MLRPQFIKSIAQAVAILVFAIAVAGPVGAVGHVHHGDTDHSALHSSLACIWMCAASSFVGTEGHHLNVSLASVEIADAEPAVPLFGNLPQNFQPRAPPVFL